MLVPLWIDSSVVQNILTCVSNQPSQCWPAPAGEVGNASNTVQRVVDATGEINDTKR